MSLKNKLAIFDLDGTLFDTKDVNYNAYQNAIKMVEIDVKIDYNDFCNLYNGKNYREFLPKIIPDITEEQMKNIHNFKKNIYTKYLDKAKKNNLKLGDKIKLKGNPNDADNEKKSDKETDEKKFFYINCY